MGIASQALEHVTWQIIHQGCGYRACCGICSVIYRFHCNEIATLKVECDVKLWCSLKCAPVVVSCVFLSVNELLLTKCLLCFLSFFFFLCSSWMYTLPIGSVVRRECNAQWKEWCLPLYLGCRLRSERCSSVMCGIFWPVRTFLGYILYLFHCSSSFENSVMRKSAVPPVDSFRQIGHFCSVGVVCRTHCDSDGKRCFVHCLEHLL